MACGEVEKVVPDNIEEVAARIHKNGQTIDYGRGEGVIHYHQTESFIVDGIKYEPSVSYAGPMINVVDDLSTLCAHYADHDNFLEETTRTFVDNDCNTRSNPWYGLKWDPTIRF